MKITLEDDQGKVLVFDHVFQMSLVGLQNFGVGPKKFSHSLIADKHELVGMLHENIERVRNHGDKHPV